MREDIINRKNDILFWISENKSKSFMCKELDCRPIVLQNAFKYLNIQYKGNKSGKGKKSTLKKSALEYLNSTCIKSHTLKIKLLEDGIKQYKCEICNNESWQNNKIPLELDHIDGNHNNNVLENIRLLCPNCHALQPTNSGKNKTLKRLMRL